MLHYPHTNSRCCTHVHLLPCGEVGSSDGSPGRQQPSPGHSELPQLALRRCPCLGKVAPQWSRHLRAHRHTTTPSELYNCWSWCVCTHLPDVSCVGSRRPLGGHSSPLWSLSANRPLGCRQSAVKQHWWASAHVSCPVPTATPTCRSVTGSLLPVELHSCVIPNLRAIAPVRRDPRVHFLANKRFTTGEALCELARVACVSAAVGDPADWRAVEVPRSGRKLEGRHLELCEALVHRRNTGGKSRHPRLAAIFLKSLLN